MKKYCIPFVKTVWGCMYVNAKNIEDALVKAEGGDCYDECDNKSDYEFSRDEIEVV